VKRRAPAKGVSWIPPLGPPRKDGPLEPPALDDLADDDADAEKTGTNAATRHVATPNHADPFDDAATAFLDDLADDDGDDGAAFEASVAGR
jgi:hypothetical protein